MAEELKGSGGKKTPFVRFLTGQKFVGDFKTKATTKVGNAYRFSVVDGNADIGTKDENKVFHPTDVAVGEEVTVFGNTQLDDKLSPVVPGDRITIIYNGKIRNPKSGREYNDYRVLRGEE